ncbi:uncharacterized protein LOC132201759 isoform X2 [Neocloeon triangulifer]|uniref:uncharacterized protein LOC132201759 isoform X2 n=1 Tax=Neocloeon triangulifer TaxID=2078957 RepID=UPI00286EDA9B|nr:uncharacterized protein LOC132201759 isoform X2 [Neocloeon triangulifer]
MQLVGKKELCENVREAMIEMSNKIGDVFEIHLVQNIAVLIQQEIDLSFDYIILVHDLRDRFLNIISDIFETQLSLIDQHYRLGSKVALVLPVELQSSNSSVSYEAVFQSAAKHGLPVIRGNLSNISSREFMGEQIIELVSTANGLWSSFGFPTLVPPDPPL